jgi:hypothetical protein
VHHVTACVDLLTQLSVDGFYALDLAAMTTWPSAPAGMRQHSATSSIRSAPRASSRSRPRSTGHVETAGAASTNAAHAADAMPDDQFVEDPNVLSTLATAEFYLDRYPEANGHVERALTVARASGRGQYVPLLHWSGVIRDATGSWPRPQPGSRPARRRDRAPRPTTSSAN